MVTRISGFASGMDIDSIVTDMLKAQRTPLNKLLQKKQILEWQRDDYRAMNTLLLNFRTNELTNMKLTTNYRTKSVSSSDESKVTATATSTANQTSFSISSVGKLATAEVWQNAGAITKTGTKFDATKSLYAQNDVFEKGNITWKEGAVLTETFKADATKKEFTIKDTANIKAGDLASWSVKVNGKSYQVVTSGTPKKDQVLVKSDGTLTFLNDVAANSDIRVDYIGSVKTEKVSISPGSTATLSQLGLTYLPKSGETTAVKLLTTDKTTNKTVESNYTLSGEGKITDQSGNPIATINSETGVITFENTAPKSNDNVSYAMEVSYSHKYTNISLISHTSEGKQYEKFLVTGADSLNSVSRKINDSKVGASLFYDEFTNKMTLTRSETGKFATTGNDLEIYGDLLNKTFRFGESTVNPVVGQNAEFTINGLKTERNTNTFTIDGVTFTLKQTFETTDTPVTVGVSNDNTKIYGNIKGFIDKYNEIIETIQAKTNETRNKDYQPLTDDDRESLSESQQEKWENIAKAGLLRRDSLLTGALSQMRSNFYSTVNNSEISSAYNQLAKIGITTSSNYLDGGKLVIDETKLKAAIEADPNSVEQLFRGENGIVHKLSDTVTSTMDKLKAKAGNSNSTNQTFTIGRELEDIAKRQDRFEDRLEQLETRYWAQFTAMETAIQKANSQSSYLSQFFSS
ncbi:MAG: flagellar filament capping protein FliD [Bacillus sp. (in: firmicutes)]